MLILVLERLGENPSFTDNRKYKGSRASDREGCVMLATVTAGAVRRQEKIGVHSKTIQVFP